MSSTATSISQQNRQYWMSIMAKAPADELISMAQPLLGSYQFTEIRPPEIGLTQVRGRMGGTGSQFNIGDVTITRCVVQLNGNYYGHSYVIGRNKQHALIAAKLDAMLQDNNEYTSVNQTVIEPLAERLKQQTRTKKAASAKTKVDFFTLVRGED